MFKESMVSALVVVVGLLGSVNLFAEQKSVHDEFTGQKYGAAGCGLGSIAFGSKKGFIQVIAATTNGTSGSQTFGISSGTSNCDSGSGDHAANVSVFVETNKVALANDVARGRGETLAGLSQVLGCQNQQTLGNVLQRNYTNIFSSEHATSTMISESILTTIRQNEELATSCAI